MNHYKVEFEVRPSGSIGVFEWHWRTVRADDAKGAIGDIFGYWHSTGEWETRGVRVTQIKEAT